MIEQLAFTLASLSQAYAEGLKPEDVVAEAFRRLSAVDDPGIFIHEARAAALAEARELGARDRGPLWGVPFAVKDNIDVAGMPTTAGCPAFAYMPGGDAEVVRRLRAAGAIAIGKTNLDQFATGLVGTRTPHSVPRNALDPAIVPGGSSSGSAVAVAHGIASFALGTDTAGSGRVPAALNGIVGLKPSLGLVSTRGVVPACRTLDCVSIFALTVDDARQTLAVAAGYDADDPFSRRLMPAAPSTLRRIGVPRESQLDFNDPAEAAGFEVALLRLADLGCDIRRIDFAPFGKTARLLYEGAWIAERTAAVGDFIEAHPEEVHPVTRKIIEAGRGTGAVGAFGDFYRLAALRRVAEAAWDDVDALAVPSIPGPVALTEDAADPFGPNTRLGTYTNFVNLLDLCALAVPSGSSGAGLPSSLTLTAPAGRDASVADLGSRLQAAGGAPLGATGWALPDPVVFPKPFGSSADRVEIFVVGAHLSGMPMNGQLTGLGGTLVDVARTAPEYRMFDLSEGDLQRPGLIRVAGEGASLEGEVWSLPAEGFGRFVAAIPPPLGIGTLRLDGGRAVKGFLAEAFATDGARDITAFGGWRSYVAQANGPHARGGVEEVSHASSRTGAT